jgi:FG-GAP-like repeat
MKNITSILLSLLGCALCATFTSTALANHRSGDFPLPEIMTGGDFNKDGNLDLAVNLSGFDNFAVLNGDGLGNFTLKRHIQLDTLSKSVTSGDVDGDGNIDVVGITQWGYNIKVYLGDGLGGFQLSNTMNGDGEPNRVQLVDLNKDGKLDIVANAPAEGKLLIYLSLGGGAFTNDPIELEKYANLVAIRTADFNNDTNVDIAVAYFENGTASGSHVQIFLGDGTGNFTVGQNFVINPQCNNVRVDDLNKDGKLDLVLAGAGAENDAGVFLSTYLGDGAGNFTLKQALDLGNGSIKGEIALADFNGDGKNDVAFPLSSDGGERGHFSTALLIFLGDGAGNFTQTTTATVGKEPGSTWAADFNKDGKMDVACSNRTDGTLSILFGNGNGTFTTHATIPLNALSVP